MPSAATIQAEIVTVQGIMAGLSSDNPAWAQYQQTLAGLLLELSQIQTGAPDPGLAVDSTTLEDPAGTNVSSAPTADDQVLTTSQATTFDTSQGLV